MTETVPVRISTAQARQRFEGCSPKYIREVCHGRCCGVPSKRSSPSIVLLPREAERLGAEYGAPVALDPPRLLASPESRGCSGCHFHASDGLCGLHETPDKPVACIASPWILSSRDTLVIRNRYRLLICYRAAPALPAYEAFRSGLVLLFGEPETDRIAGLIADGYEGLLDAEMLVDRYRDLREIGEIRATLTAASRPPLPQMSLGV